MFCFVEVAQVFCEQRQANQIRSRDAIGRWCGVVNVAPLAQQQIIAGSGIVIAAPFDAPEELVKFCLDGNSAIEPGRRGSCLLYTSDAADE